MIKHLARVLALLIITLGLTSFAQTPASAFTDRDCGDFANQAAAQAFMLASGPGDPHGLDGSDNDGRACESLPCPCGSTSPQPIASNPTPPPPTVYRETGNVTQIVDGDTLKVRLRAGGIVSVRMLGIDTPENGRCGSDAATDNLGDLAPVGSTVDLVSDPTQAAKDRYGRLLRYVKRQGGYADLSFRQMWDGFSKPYVFGGKPVARHREYVRGSSVARDEDRGLWSSCW
jgi:endonuclease YncB( thermonuclease family)